MGFSLTFWGVRGTVPCPVPSCMAYGGNTSCVEVRVAGHFLALDAGTGIRLLGKHWLNEGVREATLLLSHTHLDHISGFPFFAPAYDPEFTLTTVCSQFHGRPGVEAVLARQMEGPLFPVPLRTMGADHHFHEVPIGGGFALCESVRIRTAALNHPDGATGYRIEHEGRSLAYVTDTEHVPGKPDRAILDLIAGVDLLIYDTTYTDAEFPQRVGWGHSTWSEGIRLSRAAGVRRLALFHHAPDRDDESLAAIEAQAQAMWPGRVFAAREGMRVDLAGSGEGQGR